MGATSVLTRVKNRIRREVSDAKLRQAFGKFRSPLMLQVARTHFWRPDEVETIPGWLTYDERRNLYALGRWMPGPFLEIVSWAGLSTTAISRGIKESGEQKPFDTIDLNPSPADFRPFDGKIGFFPNGSSIPLGAMTADEYKKLEPVLNYPGGPIGMLQKHLSKFGLDGTVSINTGDFRTLPDRKYGVVFCDALHDVNEVRANAPGLLRFLSMNSILACHDVGRDERCVEEIRKQLPLGYAAVVDSLYVTELA